MAHFTPPSPKLVSMSGSSNKDDHKDDHKTTTTSKHQHKKPQLLVDHSKKLFDLCASVAL